MLTLRGRTGRMSSAAILSAVGLVGVALYGWTLWKIPDRMHLHSAQDRYNARLLVISVGGSFAVVAGLLYTARSYRLSHRGQITDRFTNALQQLDSDRLYVRVGGVQALGRLMRDSRIHHDDIVEVLAAFIRDRVPATTEQFNSAVEVPTDELIMSSGALTASRLPPPGDVQAALTALARRPRRPERRTVSLVAACLTGADLSEANLADADMTEADLAKANLENADLSRAILVRASLSGADLANSDLTRANLSAADLKDSNLFGADLVCAYARSADLTGANLAGTNLAGANLAVANLTDAYLVGASLIRSYLSMTNLNGADLTRANLRDVRGLLGEQLQEARTDALPELMGKFGRPRWSRTPGPRDQPTVS